MSKVYLAGVRKGSSEDSIIDAVRDSVESATDFSWLSRGDSVFIKPALNSGYPYPSTTSTSGIRAMVSLLKEKGAGRVVVGDMSGIEHVKLSPGGLKGSSRTLMGECGMALAALEAGAELHFFEEAGWGGFFDEPTPEGSHWAHGVTLPKILKEMDHIILMPRCGRHALAGSTLGLKAVVGYWRTDTRLEYHKDSKTFHEKTAEANAVKTLVEKQRLVLTVATKVLTCFGPDHGYVLEPEIGLVIASESIVAHDMVSFAWLLLCRQETPYWNLIWFNDPNRSRLVVNLANRWIVSMLGNITDAVVADSLENNDVKTIWQDKTLNCAYKVFGERPEVEFELVDHLISPELRGELVKMTTYPG